MDFQPYRSGPRSSRFADTVSSDRRAVLSGIAMAISGREAGRQHELIEKGGKFGVTSPTGSSGFAGDRLASAIGEIGKGVQGLFGSRSSQPWYQTSNFDPAGNSYSHPSWGGSSTPNYGTLPNFSAFKPGGWNPSSTVFGS
jgi:hypothetical protein